MVEAVAGACHEAGGWADGGADGGVDGAGTATVDSATNFFRAVREGTLYAAARPLHAGRSFIVVRTELTDDRGRPVGQTTQTQAVLAPRPAR